MKLGWFLAIAGGVYFLYRVIYAVMWALWGVNATWSDVGYMLAQAVVIGGTPLSFGIWRIVRARRKSPLHKRTPNN